jgi:hypothetical protein
MMDDPNFDEAETHLVEPDPSRTQEIAPKAAGSKGHGLTAECSVSLLSVDHFGSSWNWPLPYALMA